MKVFPSAVARDDPNFTCGAAAVLISYIHLASKTALSPSQSIWVKWPRRSANNCLCLTYSIKQAVCVSPVSHCCSLFQQTPSFGTDLTPSLQPSVPAKSLKSSGAMNEVESKALTLMQEGQQPEQRNFHNKGRGLKGLAAAVRSLSCKHGCWHAEAATVTRQTCTVGCHHSD